MVAAFGADGKSIAANGRGGVADELDGCI